MYIFLFLTVIVCSMFQVNCGNSDASECAWQDWSRWTECSVSCGGGVCVRSMTVCQCSGADVDPLNMTCPDQPSQEMLPCNQFLCGTQAPLNKGYWVTHNSETNGTPWPIDEDTHFSCSDNPDQIIEAKTWLEILQDPIYVECSAWHYLAKEFIAAECNINNQMVVPDDVHEIVSEASILLDTCCVMSNGQQHQAAILREELNRANNGLGGIGSAYSDNGTESDDDETLYGDDTTVASSNEPASPVSRMMLVIILSICFALLVIVVVSVVIWTVMFKRQHAMVEDHQFLNEENRDMEGGGEGTELGEEE